MNVSDS